MSTTDPRTTRAESPTRLTRRSVARGAAWSVPLVAVSVAAPAFAVSCAGPQPFRLNWGTTAYTKNVLTNVGTATVPTADLSGTPVVVTFTSTTSGTVFRDTDNLTVPALTNVGGLGAGERGMTLSHADPISANRNNRQTVVISFSRAVTGLSFSMTDIDSSRNDWWDRVELTGTRTAALDANLEGTGVFNDPWRYKTDNTNVDNDSSGGNVKVTYAGSVTSIQLDYWSTVASGNQRIFLTDFTFTSSCS